ncbi:helix-turn-helix transcriptional regulator [bacterium]|nr:helix-turn-helix transcriptional regulator [bacterium]
MDIKKQLGGKIKRLRQKRGLTQEQLAEKMEIAPRTLSGIESGKNFVTAETLEKVFDVLKVTSTELFAFDHIKPQEDLIEEIVKDVQMLQDRDKIETIYKIVKATINE